MGFRRIIKNFKIDGFDGFFYRLLKKLNFKIKYLNIIEKNKYNLDQRILKITNNQIISGLYSILLSRLLPRQLCLFAHLPLRLHRYHYLKILHVQWD